MFPVLYYYMTSFLPVSYYHVSGFLLLYYQFLIINIPVLTPLAVEEVEVTVGLVGHVGLHEVSTLPHHVRFRVEDGDRPVAIKKPTEH